MTQRSLERTLEWLGLLLLLGGLGGMLCLLGLLLFFPALFVGVVVCVAMSGSLVLFVGSLGRLPLWIRRRRKAQQRLACVPLTVKQPGYQPVALRVLEMVTDEAFEQIPRSVLQAIATHGVHGRMLIVRHLLEEWSPSSPKRTQGIPDTSADQTRCAVCAGLEKHALLLTCTSCQQCTHQQCSVLVRSARIKNARLCIDPTRRCHCWACLDLLQRQGFTLAHDDDGVVLIAHSKKNRR